MYFKRQKIKTAGQVIQEVENLKKMQHQQMRKQVQDNPYVNEAGDLLEWEN